MAGQTRPSRDGVAGVLRLHGERTEHRPGRAVADRAPAARGIRRALRRQNVVTTITFSQLRVFATGALARVFLAQQVAAFQNAICQGGDTLEITLLGGGLVTLANAILTSAGKPTIKNGCYFSAEYTVVGRTAHLRGR